MNKDSKICIFGASGFLGSAIVRKLQQEGYTNLILSNHDKLDLTIPIKVEMFYAVTRPEYVFMCSGLVGGIGANTGNPVEFLHNNMIMNMNVIKYSHKFNVKKLMVFGSNCMYPKDCEQPIEENKLLSSYLEPTNEGFALAKISTVKLCQYYNKQYGTNFISVVPCNLYGYGDKFDDNHSHLISALIQKMHKAKIDNLNCVELWGTGQPRREFMYVDDCADACLFLMNNYDSSEMINVGIGFDMPIIDIAEIVAGIVGYEGNIQFNDKYPDGIKCKLLNGHKIKKLGWHYKTAFTEGLTKTYQWYLKEKMGMGEN